MHGLDTTSPIKAHRSSILSFRKKGIDLNVKIAFIFVDGNLSLEVSDQTGETLEVKANFTNLLSREALSMPCT